MHKTLLTLAGLLVGAGFSASAQADGPRACQTTDITLATVVSCSGFFDKNLLNSSHIDEQKAGLLDIGLDWDGDFSSVTKRSGLNGLQDISFDPALTGSVYIGVHYGNGNAKDGGPGNSTAFYLLNAAQGLSQIHLAFGASSDLVIYSAGTPSDAPEPASWAMMVGGFGLIGGAIRRRKTSIRFA